MQLQFFNETSGHKIPSSDLVFYFSIYSYGKFVVCIDKPSKFFKLRKTQKYNLNLWFCLLCAWQCLSKFLSFLSKHGQEKRIYFWKHNLCGYKDVLLVLLIELCTGCTNHNSGLASTLKIVFGKILNYYNEASKK